MPVWTPRTAIGRGDVARRTIVDRLRAGELLILDGGTGTELQRRGVDVEKGIRGNEMGPWSAAANFDAPDVVREIHEDYLRAGADIIISNNFYTTPTMLEKIGKRDEWEAYTRRGGELAIQARDAVNPDAYVAGGIAPAASLRGPAASPRRTRATWAQNSRTRLGCWPPRGVDFMVAEYMGGGFHHRRPHLRLRDGGGCLRCLGIAGFPGPQQGEGARYAVRRGIVQRAGCRAEGPPRRRHLPDVQLCEGTSRGVCPCCAKPTTDRIGAYAHLEYNENPKFGSSPDEPFFTLAVGENTPEKYAEIARGWEQDGRADHRRVLRHQSRSHPGAAPGPLTHRGISTPQTPPPGSQRPRPTAGSRWFGRAGAQPLRPTIAASRF